jgi:hypothetical protein
MLVLGNIDLNWTFVADEVKPTLEFKRSFLDGDMYSPQLEDLNN